jgi:hypothetical protein
MDSEIIFAVLSIVIAGSALIITVTKNQSANRRLTLEDERAMDKRLDSMKTEIDKRLSDYKLEMEHRLTEIEGKVNIFWKDFETKMANFLHSPHTPETDILLEKLGAGTITMDEKLILCGFLEGHVRNKEYSPEKIPAAIALSIHLCSDRYR